MISENLAHLSLSELCDLLVTNTKELLDLMNQKKSDGMKLFHKKKDVEHIQGVIKSKKAERKSYPFPYYHNRLRLPFKLDHLKGEQLCHI